MDFQLIDNPSLTLRTDTIVLDHPSLPSEAPRLSEDGYTLVMLVGMTKDAVREKYPLALILAVVSVPPLTFAKSNPPLPTSSPHSV